MLSRLGCPPYLMTYECLLDWAGIELTYSVDMPLLSPMLFLLKSQMPVIRVGKPLDRRDIVDDDRYDHHMADC